MNKFFIIFIAGIVLILVGVLVWQVGFRGDLYNNVFSCEDSYVGT